MNQELHQRIKSIVHAIPVSKMEFIVIIAQSNEKRGIIISIIEISHITIFIKSKYARRRTSNYSLLLLTLNLVCRFQSAATEPIISLMTALN